MTMSASMSASLDRHITGNWGEDQFAGEAAFEDFLDACYSACIFQQLGQCPVDCACNGSCAVVLAMLKDEEDSHYEMSRLQDEHYEKMFLEELAETCAELERYEGIIYCNASDPGMGKKCSKYCPSVVKQ